MKKLLVLLFTLCCLSSFSQTSYYTARRSELYEKSYGNWVKTWTNTDLSIAVSFTNNVVQIMAESATTFNINNESKVEKRLDGFYIIRYNAFEIVNRRSCVVDLLKYDNTSYTVFSVTYNDVTPAMNIRYYLFKD